MVKIKSWLLPLLVFSLGMITGCSNHRPADASIAQADKSAAEHEEVSSPVPDILTEIQIEAGSSELTQEQLFDPYQDQTVIFERELTTEELAAAGEIYEIPVRYQDDEILIHVEIVDTTPPKIEVVGDLSVDKGETLSYKKAVTLSDNSSQKITLEVDNSLVDLNTPGTYPVRYTATDASGNAASVEITVTVNELPSPEEEKVIQLADAVIADVISDDMSQYEQAYVLWEWCRNHITYSYSDGNRSSVWTGAYEGLYDRKGDCYAYYATYAVLLDRCEIPNMCVERVGGNSEHFWNLVNTGDGWYHCDTSPRSKKHPYYCFMQTDAQVKAYTDSYPEHPNYYTFDPALYPQRAAKIIYGN